MSGDGGDGESTSVVDRLPLLVRGREDTRIRAGWRVLVAAVVFLPLAEVVALTVAGAVAPLVGAGQRPPPVLVSALVACVLAALLVPWARYVDRRPLSDYGFSRSPAWGVDLLAGFGAVSLGYGLWFALASALGGSDVEVSLAGPEAALLLWLVAGLLTNLLSALAQDTVFFGVILQNAAEGIRGWDVTPARAVVGGWLLSILFFILIHGAKPDPMILLNWVVGAGVFGLLYVHTGELALPIGAHAANNFVSNAVQLSGPVPVPGVVSDWAFPKMVAAYLLVLAWLYWRHDEVTITEDIAEWSGR